MALNIKNERTVALIRELADATGQNMTSAVEEAIIAKLEQVRSQESEAAVAIRLSELRQAVDELHASMTDEQREALRTAEADLYDEQGLYR